MQRTNLFKTASSNLYRPVSPLTQGASLLFGAGVSCTYCIFILYFSISVSNFLQLSPSPPLSISISTILSSPHLSVSPSQSPSPSPFFSRNKDGSESLRSAFCEIYVHKIYSGNVLLKKKTAFSIDK